MSKSVAIVTGASQGIGQSPAIRLARAFSALVLVARDRANREKTAEAVRVACAEALVIDTDLAQPSAARTVVDQALQKFCRIDALLNIAGAVPQIDLFEMTDRMIVHENQRFMAERMKALVRAHPVEHAPLVTAPAVVVDVIREAIPEVLG
jgi:short-subunit dehydrogenase